MSGSGGIKSKPRVLPSGKPRGENVVIAPRTKPGLQPESETAKEVPLVSGAPIHERDQSEEDASGVKPTLTAAVDEEATEIQDDDLLEDTADAPAESTPNGTDADENDPEYLRDRITALEARIQRMGEALRREEELRTKSQSEALRLAEETKSVRELAANTTKELANAQALANDRGIEIVNYKARVRDLMTALDAAEKQVASLNVEITALRDQLATEKNQHAIDNKNLLAEANKLRSDLAQARKESATVDADLLAALRSQNQNLRSDLAKAERLAKEDADIILALRLRNEKLQQIIDRGVHTGVTEELKEIVERGHAGASRTVIVERFYRQSWFIPALIVALLLCILTFAIGYASAPQSGVYKLSENQGLLVDVARAHPGSGGTMEAWHWGAEEWPPTAPTIDCSLQNPNHVPSKGDPPAYNVKNCILKMR